jgi:endoglucanase
VCLAIDVTHATDSPGVSKEKHGDIRLGWATISFGSTNHPLVVRRLLEVASKGEIKVQREVAPRRTGTDLDHIVVQGGGIAGAVIGIPNRYMHSAVEMVHLGDLENTARLVAAFCRDVGGDERFRVKIDV